MQQIVGIDCGQPTISVGTGELIMQSSVERGLLLYLTIYDVDTAEPSRIASRRKPRQVTTLTASISLGEGARDSKHIQRTLSRHAR